MTPDKLEAGIAAAEREGIIDPTASQVLAIYTAMHQARPVDEMIELDAMIGRSKFHGGPDQEITIRQWLSADNRTPQYRARRMALRLIEQQAAALKGDRSDG